ncbi:hypothetical protein ABT127_34915 [Streptomyces sp. NPDC001904]|uniref:hypothetical protein n=1 Tax=Streptomyces sp. NPDC001904 TaxID=3154531 RepID=UPI00331A9C6D
MLFPVRDDVASWDFSWSSTGFGLFRRWLARAEVFALAEMNWFGAKRQWCRVTTTLERVLNHADIDGPT